MSTVTIPIDASAYVKKTELPSNLTLYPTTVDSAIIGYKLMVTSMGDPNYDEPAVDITTPTINGTDILISELATVAGVLVGSPGIVNISTVGNIRRVSGSSKAVFYYKLFRRNSSGVETLLATSSNTSEVDINIYEQFSVSAVLNDGQWTATDLIVVKYYGSKVGGGSNSVFAFEFGGANPVRTIVPVPASVTLSDYEKIANKQNSLATDATNTKYPTVTAVKTHTDNTSNPHAVTKAQVGLSDVDNTADIFKPVSVAQALALNDKQNLLVSGINIKSVNGNSLLGIGDLTIGGSSSITIGTTPITGGTNNRFLIQTGGVVSQLPNLNWDVPTETFLFTSAQSTVATFNGLVNSYIELGDATKTGASAVKLRVSGGSFELGLTAGNSTFTSGAGANTFKIIVGGGECVRAVFGQRVGIALTAAPTAKLHLPASTTAASSAPLKFNSGVLMTTPENGAFEYDGTNLYFTVGGVRKTVTLV